VTLSYGDKLSNAQLQLEYGFRVTGNTRGEEKGEEKKEIVSPFQQGERTGGANSLCSGSVKTLLRLCQGCGKALLRLCQGCVKALLSAGGANSLSLSAEDLQCLSDDTEMNLATVDKVLLSRIRALIEPS
jgi:hypothetical protein